MTTLRGRFLLILAAVLFLLRWQPIGAAAVPSPVAAALTLYCGNGNCETENCDPQIPSGGPGDGCEENQSNCPDDCGYCGDSRCDLIFENPSNCATDCGYCGDAYCNPFFETVYNCSADCSGGEGGGDRDHCGNDECEPELNENCYTCTDDCHSEEDCGFCGDNDCAPTEIGGAGRYGADNCEPLLDPWCTYCPDDCGTCDPGYCHDEEGGKICADEYGRCTDCYIDVECAGFTNEYCELSTGSCTGSTPCTSWTQCAWWNGWFCND